MSKRANPTAVGAFVVGAIVLTLLAILAFGRGTFLQREYKMIAHFDSSVKGLDVGAPILFQGVRVGRVSRVSAVWGSDEKIRVPVELTFTPGSVRATPEMRADFDARGDYAFVNELIDRGLRGELRLDSLVTGKLYVALAFHPDEEPHRLGGTEYPELPTAESGLLRLQKELENLPTGELFAKTVRAVESLDDLVNSGRITELVDRLISLAGTIEEQVVPLSQSMQETLADARTSLDRVADEASAASGSVQTLMASTDDEVQSVSAGLQHLIEGADDRLGPLAQVATQTLEETREAVKVLDRVLGDDPTMLYRTAAALEELAAAARSIRQLADYLERHPEALISGKRK